MPEISNRYQCLQINAPDSTNEKTFSGISGKNYTGRTPVSGQPHGTEERKPASSRTCSSGSRTATVRTMA
jgi:hypothetical protein